MPVNLGSGDLVMCQKYNGLLELDMVWPLLRGGRIDCS